MEYGKLTVETFDNVFDALCDTEADAANMSARADLMLANRAEVEVWGLPQEQAAAQLGPTRPRLNDLLLKKLDKFSLNELVNIATSAGLKLRIEMEGTSGVIERSCFRS